MKQNVLITFLNNYTPAAPEEILFKSTMLHFIAAHEDCFERTLAIGHITASC